jgi:hypothetical protein
MIYNISSGENGAVFIEDLVPDQGNISKEYAESDNRITGGSSSPDVTEITVHILAFSAHTNIRPVVTVNGESVVWDTLPNPDSMIYRGTVLLSPFNFGTISAVHEDGPSYSIEVTEDAVPEITTLEFVGSYPGTQTELKEDDPHDIFVETDIDFVQIEIDNFEAGKHLLVPVASTTSSTITIVIADRGDLPIQQRARVRVQKSTGAWSAWIETSNQVTLNNLHPTVGPISIGYPLGQEALKDSEEATVSSTCSNFTDILYSSSSSEVSIPNETVYAPTKTNVVRIGGSYNVTTPNYSIQCTRSQNGAVTNRQAIIKIAHTDPVISLSFSSYFRSGGNDGTFAQNHLITLNSTQDLLQAPTLADPPVGAGEWLSGWVYVDDDHYTRQLVVHDDDIKGSYSWGALSVVNLAGKEVTTITAGTTYALKGFVSRSIPLEAFKNEAFMNVAAVNYSNVTLSWSGKSLPNKRSVGTTTIPDPESWCLDTLETNPTLIRILDTSATSSVSQESTIIVEET